MNYTEIIEELEKASLFDLYRLVHALSDEIKNPAKIQIVKNNLRVGQIVSNYNAKHNKLNDVEIIEMNQSNCVVRDISNDSFWTTPYAAFNLDSVDISIATNQKYGLKKHQISTGEILTFLDNDNKQRYGEVIRLNQKSVTLLVDDSKWRVAYSLLGKNIDLDGKVVEKNLIIDHNIQS